MSFYPVIRVPYAKVRRRTTLRVYKGAASTTGHGRRRTSLTAISIAIIRRVFQSVLGNKVFTYEDPQRIIVRPARSAFNFRMKINFANYRFNDGFTRTQKGSSVLLALNDVFLVGNNHHVVKLRIFQLRVVPFTINNGLGNFKRCNQFTFSDAFLRMRYAIATLKQQGNMLQFTNQGRLSVLLPNLILAKVKWPTASSFPNERNVNVCNRHMNSTRTLQHGGNLTLFLRDEGSFKRILRVRFLTTAQQDTFLNCLSIVTDKIRAGRVESNVTRVTFLSVRRRTLRDFKNFPLTRLLVNRIKGVLTSVILRLKFHRARVHGRALMRIILPVVKLTLKLHTTYEDRRGRDSNVR